MSRGPRLKGLHSLVFQPSVPAKFSLICVFFFARSYDYKNRKNGECEKKSRCPGFRKTKNGTPNNVPDLSVFICLVTQKNSDSFAPYN